jgi:hypothetical protein
VTISASHVPVPVAVAVAVKDALGVIHATRLSPAQTLWTVCPDRQPGGQACVPRRVTTKDRSRWRHRLVRVVGNRFKISTYRGCVVVLVGRYFTMGALLSDRSGVAMIRAAP